MSITALEAWDLIRFSDQFLERLNGALGELEKRRSMKGEKAWLDAADGLVRAARELEPTLVEQARGLPDLEEIRGELAAQVQVQWVELLERLLAGFTFHVGSRDPVIEALFPTQKLAPLARANREVVEAFHAELERRMKSGYVSRMLGQPNLAFAGPMLEQIAAIYAKWKATQSGGVFMHEPEATEVRKALIVAGKRLELAINQARLLAEAALLPVPDLFESSGLNAKPRRRASKAPGSMEEVAARHAAEASKTAPAPKPAAPVEAAPKASVPVEAADSAATAVTSEAPQAVPAETAAAPADAPAAAPAPKKRKAKKAPAEATSDAAEESGKTPA